MKTSILLSILLFCCFYTAQIQACGTINHTSPENLKNPSSNNFKLNVLLTNSDFVPLKSSDYQNFNLLSVALIDRSECLTSDSSQLPTFQIAFYTDNAYAGRFHEISKITQRTDYQLSTIHIASETWSLLEALLDFVTQNQKYPIVRKWMLIPALMDLIEKTDGYESLVDSAKRGLKDIKLLLHAPDDLNSQPESLTKKVELFRDSASELKGSPTERFLEEDYTRGRILAGTVIPTVIGMSVGGNAPTSTYDYCKGFVIQWLSDSQELKVFLLNSKGYTKDDFKIYLSRYSDGYSDYYAQYNRISAYPSSLDSGVLSIKMPTDSFYDQPYYIFIMAGQSLLSLPYAFVRIQGEMKSYDFTVQSNPPSLKFQGNGRLSSFQGISIAGISYSNLNITDSYFIASGRQFVFVEAPAQATTAIPFKATFNYQIIDQILYSSPFPSQVNATVINQTETTPSYILISGVENLLRYLGSGSPFLVHESNNIYGCSDIILNGTQAKCLIDVLPTGKYNLNVKAANYTSVIYRTDLTIKQRPTLYYYYDSTPDDVSPSIFLYLDGVRDYTQSDLSVYLGSYPAPIYSFNASTGFLQTLHPLNATYGTYNVDVYIKGYGKIYSNITKYIWARPVIRGYDYNVIGPKGQSAKMLFTYTGARFGNSLEDVTGVTATLGTFSWNITNVRFDSITIVNNKFNYNPITSYLGPGSLLRLDYPSYSLTSIAPTTDMYRQIYYKAATQDRDAYLKILLDTRDGGLNFVNAKLFIVNSNNDLYACTSLTVDSTTEATCYVNNLPIGYYYLRGKVYNSTYLFYNSFYVDVFDFNQLKTTQYTPITWSTPEGTVRFTLNRAYGIEKSDFQVLINSVECIIYTFDINNQYLYVSIPSYIRSGSYLPLIRIKGYSTNVANSYNQLITINTKLLSLQMSVTPQIGNVGKMLFTLSGTGMGQDTSTASLKLNGTTASASIQVTVNSAIYTTTKFLYYAPTSTNWTKITIDARIAGFLFSTSQNVYGPASEVIIKYITGSSGTPNFLQIRAVSPVYSYLPLSEAFLVQENGDVYGCNQTVITSTSEGRCVTGDLPAGNYIFYGVISGAFTSRDFWYTNFVVSTSQELVIPTLIGASVTPAVIDSTTWTSDTQQLQLSLTSSSSFNLQDFTLVMGSAVFPISEISQGIMKINMPSDVVAGSYFPALYLQGYNQVTSNITSPIKIVQQITGFTYSLTSQTGQQTQMQLLVNGSRFGTSSAHIANSSLTIEGVNYSISASKSNQINAVGLQFPYISPQPAGDRTLTLTATINLVAQTATIYLGALPSTFTVQYVRSTGINLDYIKITSYDGINQLLNGKDAFQVSENGFVSGCLSLEINGLEAKCYTNRLPAGNYNFIIKKDKGTLSNLLRANFVIQSSNDTVTRNQTLEQINAVDGYFTANNSQGIFTLKVANQFPSSIQFRVVSSVSNDYAIIKVPYLQDSILVFSNNITGNIITSLTYSFGFAPTLSPETSICGSNFYNQLDQTYDVFVIAGSECVITMQQTTALAISIRYDIPISTFTSQGGVNTFINALAALLGISPSQVLVKALTQGSVIIDFALISKRTAAGLSGDGNDDTELTSLSSRIDSALNSGQLLFYGESSKVLSYSNKGTGSTSSGTTPQQEIIVTQQEASGSGSIILFIVIPIIVVLAVVVLIMVWKLRKAKKGQKIQIPRETSVVSKLYAEEVKREEGTRKEVEIERVPEIDQPEQNELQQKIAKSEKSESSIKWNQAKLEIFDIKDIQSKVLNIEIKAFDESDPKESNVEIQEIEEASSLKWGKPESIALNLHELESKVMTLGELGFDMESQKQTNDENDQ